LELAPVKLELAFDTSRFLSSPPLSFILPLPYRLLVFRSSFFICNVLCGIIFVSTILSTILADPCFDGGLF